MLSKILQLAPVVLLGFISHALAGTEDSCILNATTCQCASTTPSGTCIRSLGDGNCVLGVCNEGYRCDCQGFELCSISSCGKYMGSPGAIPTATEPFACQYATDAAMCTTPVKVLDSVSAANNAAQSAVESTEDATADTIEAVLDIADIQRRKAEFLSVLKQLEEFSDAAEEHDLRAIDLELGIVNCAVQETSELAADASRDAKQVAKARRETQKLTRMARKAEKMWKEENKKMRKKHERPSQFVEEILKRKKDSGTASGQQAKAGREFRKRCSEKCRLVRMKKEASKKAYNRGMQKSFQCLAKAKGLIPVATR